MTDFLHTQLTQQEQFETGMLGFAHIGDAVYELMVRAYLCKKGMRNAKTLHRNTVGMVSAGAQAKYAEKILNMLTEKEKDVYMRGRNAKVNSVPKGADLADYHAATGFECLFGMLYLSGEYDRLNEIFKIIVEE